VRANAVVRAVAETQVVVLGPGHVEPVRLGEHPLVAVAGREPHHDLVPGPDLLSTEDGVGRRRTPEPHHR
jgi:hypothetical protein